MRNSAWYHKLWRRKFESLPVKDAADASWANMRGILDANIPVSSVPGNAANPSWTWGAFKGLLYVVSTVVAVSIVSYIVTKPQDKLTTQKKHRDQKEIINLSIDSSVINSRLILSDKMDSLMGIRNPVKGIGVDEQINTAVPIFRPGSIILGGGAKSKALADTNVDVAERQLLPIEPLFLKGASDFAVGIDIDNKYLTGVTSTSEKQITFAKTYGKIKSPEILKRKSAKDKRVKDRKITGQKQLLSYGISTGANLRKDVTNLYVGIFGSYGIGKNFQVSAGLNMNSYEMIAGEFSHASYFRPDSLPAFTIADGRKVIAVDIPIKISYNLSKYLSINLGPMLSFPVSKSAVVSQVNPVADVQDTLNHGKEISKFLGNSLINKAHFGLTGGISIHLKRFDINGTYQLLTPYRITDSLGSYSKRNRFFRIGLGYRFK
ncbi:outer membrane beta-barrel protein [Pedobacter duraquae]|uniref:Outer membrane protein with beta-barrel domain n=1 Tax=Pedobacter duraquae TaxID=425511 RepID=A0A4R6IF43_9SPHI|nr:outer membrane beta-barrel protein [Pedobacter duraquae]TDO20682.1 outer membrane protein with beta-barrel domain [Pedobacter duraquae]